VAFFSAGRTTFPLHGSGSRHENSGIFLQSLDSTNRIRLLADVSNPTYAGGYLLFARGGTLMAQRFDVGKLRLTGEPFPITGRVGVSGVYAHAEYSVSTNGLLVYNPSGFGSGNRWTWFDRRGKRLAEIGEPGAQLRGQLSPDEKQVVIDRLDPQLGTYDLWLIDLARGTSSRFTFDPGTEYYPVWSPDGARIAFASNRAGAFDIYAKASSGAGKEELLAKSDLANIPLTGLAAAAFCSTPRTVRKRLMTFGCCRSLTRRRLHFCKPNSASGTVFFRPTGNGSLTLRMSRAKRKFM
jgi:hypothetical protein